MAKPLADVRRTVSKGGKSKEIVVFRKDHTGPEGKGRARLVLTEDGADYIVHLFAMAYTEEEVALDIGVTIPTLHAPHNRALFSAAKQKGEAQSKMSIKRQMFSILNGGKGNVTMAIFMAKAYLHLSDQPRAEPPDVPFDAGIEEQLARFKDGE